MIERLFCWVIFIHTHFPYSFSQRWNRIEIYSTDIIVSVPSSIFNVHAYTLSVFTDLICAFIFIFFYVQYLISYLQFWVTFYKVFECYRRKETFSQDSFILHFDSNSYNLDVSRWSAHGVPYRYWRSVEKYEGRK